MRSAIKRSVAVTLSVAVAAAAVTLGTLRLIDVTAASIVTAIAALLPLLLLFERRATERELVLVSVLTALAVIGRWAFAWAPNVTMSTGIIIIAGMTLGGAGGLAAGAMTAFISNMLLGQGLWSPWQALCMSLIGLGAAAFRDRDIVWACVYAVFCGFAYGFVMDIFTLVTVYGADITREAFFTVWGASFLFDALHAASAAVTVALLGGIMRRKIKRALK